MNPMRNNPFLQHHNHHHLLRGRAEKGVATYGQRRGAAPRAPRAVGVNCSRNASFAPFLARSDAQVLSDIAKILGWQHCSANPDYAQSRTDPSLCLLYARGEKRNVLMVSIHEREGVIEKQTK